jgi:hypothetical protein
MFTVPEISIAYYCKNEVNYVPILGNNKSFYSHIYPIQK